MTRRAAGLLLHPTSLLAEPGGLEGAAGRFLPWAKSAGLSVWQILPVGPPGEGGSPYAALSAFAGDASWFPDVGTVDRARFEAFCIEHAAWLDDWSLFAALKEAHGGLPWFAWDEPLRRRDPVALTRARTALAGPVERCRIRQMVFFARWNDLRERAREHGISILGDVPIYPALDSADVWAHQDLFHLDADGAPTKVAGVPPDYFSATGQLWGNPIYRWDRLAQSGFSWWIDRLRHGLALHDALRLDHFRGFAGYWAVPADAETAEDGAWEPGPGAAFFEAARTALGGLPFVAEDLGVITDDVVALRKGLELPGMRVLQFAFEGDPSVRQFETDTVVYTGTHDNDTTRGWFESLDRTLQARVLDEVGGSAAGAVWGLIRFAYRSRSQLAIAPLQDVLELGSPARMNVPGIASGNWRWRIPPEAFTKERARRLLALTEESGRGC
jgi:4-alpha-glucanotransferase